MEWRLCASAEVSVAMKLESMGYGLHGHDVTVTACLCYPGEGPREDLEAIGAALSRVLSAVNRRPLWEVTGGEGSLEDLLLFVREGLSRLGLRGRLCELTAETQGGSRSARLLL